MKKLFEIEFFKLRYSRTFWVVCIIYTFLIVATPLSIAGILAWIKSVGGDFDGFDPMKIPILHFPDVWQNLTFLYGLIRIFLGILVIISVTNEFSYRTIRQNIIDGMSRMQFVVSKLAMFFVISICAGVLVFFVILISGLLSTPELESGDITYGLQFIGAFTLDLFTYLSLALLIAVLIQRTGLAIAVILVLTPFEFILGASLPSSVEKVINYFPMHQMFDLVSFPFHRYGFREIQDYVSITTVLIVMAYAILFIYLTQLKLKKTDL